MAIEYKWEFPTLDVVYNKDGFQNVVQTIHWIYTAIDGDYTAYLYGTVGLPSPGQPFISYSDLTGEIVQGWVKSVLGEDKVNEMSLSLAGNIASQKNPKSGSMSPPWVA